MVQRQSLELVGFRRVLRAIADFDHPAGQSDCRETEPSIVSPPGIGGNDGFAPT